MKTLSLLCALALLCAPFAAASADDAAQLQDAMQYTAYGYIYGSGEWEATYPISDAEAPRKVYAQITGRYGSRNPLILPDDFEGDPASFRFQGVRLTFDTPIDYSWSGNRVINAAFEDEVLRPVKVELMPITSYGIIVERGEDYIVQDIIYDTENYPSTLTIL